MSASHRELGQFLRRARESLSSEQKGAAAGRPYSARSGVAQRRGRTGSSQDPIEHEFGAAIIVRTCRATAMFEHGGVVEDQFVKVLRRE